MGDAELEALVRRFQELQRGEGASYITERNAVEIVNVLLQKKLINLLYTTDAKEYLTWPELKREIVDELQANAGRMNVVELPALLGVHALYVERALPEVLAETRPSIRIENGELMTATYLDTVVQEAADMLKESGSLSVVDFAAHHHLASGFAHQLLAGAVQSGRLIAVLHENALFTRHFVRAQRLILRAALLAVVRPVSLVDLGARHELFLPLLDSLVGALQAELPGRVEGGRYVPTRYEDDVARQVDNVLTSNGYISYDAAQRLGVRNPRQYLLQRYGGSAPSDKSPLVAGGGSGHARSTRHRRRGGRTSTSAASAKCGAGGCTPGDGSAARLPVRQADGEGRLWCGYALRSCFLLDRFLATLPPGLQALVDGEVVAADLAEQWPNCLELAADWPLLAGRLAELHPELAAAVLVGDRVLLLPPATKAKAALIARLIAAAAELAQATSADRHARELRELAAVLQLRPAEEYTAALEEVAELWAETLATAEARVANASAASGATTRLLGASAMLRDSRAALQHSLSTAWVELGVVGKGLAWARAQLDEAAAAMLTRHAVQGRGFALCRDVLLNESLDRPELHARVAAALADVRQGAQLVTVLLAFPERAREALMPMLDALLLPGGAAVERLMGVLQEMSGGGVIAVSGFHAPGRKVERDMYAQMRAGVEAEVRQGGAAFGADAAANGKSFAAICALLAHRVFHIHLELVGPAVGSLVARLSREAASDAEAVPTTLNAAQECITNALQSAQPVPSESIAMLDALRAAVLD